MKIKHNTPILIAIMTIKLSFVVEIEETLPRFVGTTGRSVEFALRFVTTVVTGEIMDDVVWSNSLVCIEDEDDWIEEVGKGKLIVVVGKEFGDFVVFVVVL